MTGHEQPKLQRDGAFWRQPAIGYAASGDPAWAARAADELAGFGV